MELLSFCHSRLKNQEGNKPSKHYFFCLTATLQSNVVVQNICNAKAKSAKNKIKKNLACFAQKLQFSSKNASFIVSAGTEKFSSSTFMTSLKRE